MLAREIRPPAPVDRLELPPELLAVLPIGRAIDGGLLCVDLRQGEHHGGVVKWYASEGIYESGWTSVAERLDGREPPPVIGEATAR
ncbi:hypothetical protein ACFWIW_27880 [Amycolatopsis sp. NPDC058340]|uniref:hypothetical protein n=1 Tax=Amycolatopsis sp. NPDC058340 TaxID=3346453 RepID=UPI0036612D0A